MTGYQEILTDPVVPRADRLHDLPAIGNYGVNAEDVESRRPWVAGFIVKEASPSRRRWRGDGERSTTTCASTGSSASRASTPARSPGTCAITAPRRASSPRASRRRGGSSERARALPGLRRPRPGDRGHVTGALRLGRGRVATSARGYTTPPARALPASSRSTRGSSRTSCAAAPARLPGRGGAGATPARPRCSSAKPDGVFLSNGPGDPGGGAVPDRVGARARRARRPIFGICLGQPDPGARRSAAAPTSCKFGHHGGNHPVKDLHRAGRDHRRRTTASRWTRRRSRSSGWRRRTSTSTTAPRGHAAPRAADLLRAVPPGGLAGSARLALPVPSVRRPHESRGR